MDMISVEQIKKNIAEAIVRSGIPQTELARKLSVSQSCIAHYARGDILPSLDTFAKLCALMDEDPSYLLGLQR